jgi:tRNA (cmo5U34)-methyltransferase
MELESSSGSHRKDASVGEFFNRVSDQYDQSIRKAIPPYQEMFEAVLGYCFLENSQPLSILELGCGTGNLSLLLRQLFPQAHLTLVDLSPDMLQQASQKLGGPQAALSLVEGGFMDLDFPDSSFHFIVSSMALHHLLDNEKLVLYRRLFQWLKPGGIFRCADETLALPSQAHDANISQWEQWAKQHGATDEDIVLWTEHAEAYDHYAPLANHFQWLQEAGFTNIDCYWRKLMWTVFGGQKPLA